MGGFGIVLGGGGAKGGYEIGVWKALRQLDIPIKVITGTSVGALNGAIMAQGDFEVAEKLWTSINIEDVIKVEKEVAAVEEGYKKTAGIISTIRDAITSGGLDVTPLRQMLMEIIDEKKIRESDIDLGIVTFSLTDFKPVRLFKKDIPEGELVDYLLASACFPAFKPHEIGNKKFIDGGVYDNIPISMMAERGIKNVIVVDISGPGMVRKIDEKDLNIVYIKNSDDLGGTLDFDGKRSSRNMDMGYYDTLKIFGKLEGSKYYIIPCEKNSIYREAYIQSVGINDFKKMYSFLGLDWGSKSTARNELIIYKIMKTIKQYTVGKLNWDSILPAMAEITAEQIGINRINTYTLDELIDKIVEQYDSIRVRNDFNQYVRNIKDTVLSISQLEFNRQIKNIFIEGKFLIFFNPDIDENDEAVKRFRRFIAMAFPKISIANMFISIILSRESKDVRS